MANTAPIVSKFLKWRYRHISQKNFIFFLSGIVGLLAGILAVTLKNITFSLQSFIEHVVLETKHGLYFIIPIVGLAIVFLLKKYLFVKPLRPETPDFIKRSIPMLLYSLFRQKGLVSIRLLYRTLILAPLTVGFGGSVGLLGPAITSGASLSSNLGRFLHVDKKTRTLLIACATSGAMASMFKSPIAAVVFAVEVFSLDLTFASLLPLLIASISSVLTSYFFLGEEVLFSATVLKSFHISDTLFYVALGLGTGIASIYFTRSYFAIYDIFDRLKSPFARLMVGGVAIGALLYFIPPLYGEGISFTTALLEGNHLKALGSTPFDAYSDSIWVVIALLIGFTIFKAIAMTTTFAAGGVGGVIIPTMVMGSALGNVFAKVLNNLGLGFEVSEVNFTLVGMAGLMAGVVNAPLTAIFLIAEITGGYALFVPLMITVAISFMISKNTMEHSIFTRELAMRDALLTYDRDRNALLLLEFDKIIEHNFVTVPPDMLLGEILTHAVANSNRNLYPVVNEENKFLGVIFLNDLRKIMFDSSLYDKISAKELMENAPALLFYNQDSMNEIMAKFEKSGAWNLPVIKEGRYHGFISKSKLLTAYRRKLVDFTRQ